MSHHKRRRPKHQRAGCLTCKPWKDERGAKDASGRRPRAALSLDEDGYDSRHRWWWGCVPLEEADQPEQCDCVECVVGPCPPPEVRERIDRFYDTGVISL